MDYLKKEYEYALESHFKALKEERETVDLLNRLSILVGFVLIICFGLYIGHTLGNPYYVLPNIF